MCKYFESLNRKSLVRHVCVCVFYATSIYLYIYIYIYIDQIYHRRFYRLYLFYHVCVAIDDSAGMDIGALGVVYRCIYELVGSFVGGLCNRHAFDVFLADQPRAPRICPRH